MKKYIAVLHFDGLYTYEQVHEMTKETPQCVYYDRKYKYGNGDMVEHKRENKQELETIQSRCVTETYWGKIAAVGDTEEEALLRVHRVYANHLTGLLKKEEEKMNALKK